ncbi:MAG: acyl-CoA thioesterase II [Desulfobacterales bacterium]|nr:acyl-CoA thioesterase II [Desulfobacterales bacterium]
MSDLTCTHQVLDELLDLLKLEAIEENIFRGKSQDLGFGNIFGGQVLGQALSAACQTAPIDRSVHSLHGYFMRPGDPKRPIVYQVDCIRDGKSFTTRRVMAIQKGHAIFSMEASFQVQESGFEHQASPPEVPGPENFASELERARQFSHKIPSSIRAKLTCDRPIEIRPVNPINPFKPEKLPPVRYSWFKAVDKLPDDISLHRYLLAYASDFGLVATSLYPHGHTFWEPQMQVASLDHAMWFYREFRMDDWLLYKMESPCAGNARGLNHGYIYTREGQLVALTAQEGLIRYKRD